MTRGGPALENCPSCPFVRIRTGIVCTVRLSVLVRLVRPVYSGQNTPDLG